jgi:hypothetical protein
MLIKFTLRLFIQTILLIPAPAHITVGAELARDSLTTIHLHNLPKIKRFTRPPTDDTSGARLTHPIIPCPPQDRFNMAYC